jgi:hypothetical protein
LQRFKKQSAFKKHQQKGRLAQLVQSIWFTPRGSAVRIRHRPQKKSFVNSDDFFYFVDCLIFGERSLAMAFMPLARLNKPKRIPSFENEILLFVLIFRSCYFAGMFFSVSTRKSQNLLTDSMFTFSSGECGKRMVGPNEIMSQFE